MFIELSEHNQLGLLSSREVQKELQDRGLLDEAMSNLNKDIIIKIIEKLESPELQDIIDQGELTMGMIKPMLRESSMMNDDLSEDEQSELLLQEIKPPLESMFDIVLFMGEDTLDKWYVGKPKDSQSEIEPIDVNRYGLTVSSRWEEFSALMNRGPVTFVLLHDKDGNAIEEWRNQMGNNWRVDEVKQQFPDSLRARYAKDNHNNLLHGSDSIETVKKEIELLVELLRKLLEK